MGFTFDHIVHLVNDPLQAAADLREKGFHAIEGGRHTHWGTYNSLCYFDLSYIEFLGVYDRTLTEAERENLLVHDCALRLPQQEGFVRVAIRTDDIVQTADMLQKRGLNVSGPFPGSRVRPDGKRLSWSMLFVSHHESSLRLPFFIQWGEGDEERRADLTERGAIAPHELGPLALGAVKIAVAELASHVQQWSGWFGLTCGEPFIDESMQAVCQTVHLPGGNLLFCSPTGSGLVADIIAAQGEGIFELEVVGANQEGVHEQYGATYRWRTSENSPNRNW
ncbi:VOC family protein [Brevibacillus fluminis]|uniref:VOC family protein n=1 Tax=Brevibacillus fluminis TaxID=511487 RepID=A0A3M8CVY7_9BACL|nr:VOC family protein [Brevibacillus fluminis]RNB79521.1 VOC family protein [Brevibacillus fluminis]